MASECPTGHHIGGQSSRRSVSARSHFQSQFAAVGTGRLTPDARFGHEHRSTVPVRRRRCLDRASGHVTPTARRSDMGWLEPMPLIAVLLMIAIAAAGGFWASAVVQRKKARNRGPFLVGVFCGVMVGVALAGRRPGFNAMGASTLRAVIRPLPAGIVASAGGVVAGALTVVASLVRTCRRRAESPKIRGSLRTDTCASAGRR